MKSKPAATPRPEQLVESAQALGHAWGDMWKSVAGLSLPANALTELQSNYLKQATDLWNQTLSRLHPDCAKETAPAAPITDKRFSAPEWSANPASAYTAQMYLLNARTLMQLAESMQGDAKTKARVRFAVQQWVDAMSPANFMALNPEAQKKALETKGESVAQGDQRLAAVAAQLHLHDRVGAVALGSTVCQEAKAPSPHARVGLEAEAQRRVAAEQRFQQR